MSDVNIQPRALKDRYLDVRHRLMGRQRSSRPIGAVEAQRLREENQIMRAFIQDHGGDVDSVLEKHYAHLSTDVTVRDIIVATANHFGVGAKEIMSGRRNGYILTPRHIAFYLSCRLTSSSLTEIGREFGNRDHTTVMHGSARIAGTITTDKALRNSIEVIKSDLLASAGVIRAA